MQKYSVFSLIKNALKGHKDWEVAWKNPTPKSEYDVIIIGVEVMVGHRLLPCKRT